jgi:hypothetical protein
MDIEFEKNGRTYVVLVKDTMKWVEDAQRATEEDLELAGFIHKRHLPEPPS